MIRDRILTILEGNSGVLTASGLAQQLELSPDPSKLNAIEALLLFINEVGLEGNRWKIVRRSRRRNILSAIEAYANASGKKIFRLSAALSEIPVNEHPTEDELKDILDGTNGAFQLLRNAMIKRNR